MDEISPFFVLEAEEKLKAELLDEAISLCEKGLKEFPEYNSGWVVLIKALIRNQNFDIAKEKVEIAISKFPNISVFLKLKEEINDLIENSNQNGLENDNLQVDDTISENVENEPDELSESVNVDEENIEAESNEIIDDVTQESDLQESVNETSVTLEESEEQKDELNISKEETKEIAKTQEFDETDNSITGENTQSEEDNDIIELKDENYNNIDLKQGFLIQFFNADNIDFEDNEEMSPEIYELIPQLPESSFLERKSFRDLNIIDFVSNYHFPNKQKEKKEIISEIEEIPETIEDEFSQLAKKLENAKIPKPENAQEKTSIQNVNDNQKPEIIVSETMANIYAQQGAYKEAERAYKELLENNPERKQYFLDKLNNLYKKMS